MSRSHEVNVCRERDTRDISCIQLYMVFFRIGLTTFGGGFSMATVLRHELVLKRGWMDENDFFNTLSTATAVPGAVAVNLAFTQGWKMRGFPGALAAAAGQVSPSIVILLLVARFAAPYFEKPLFAAFLKGAAVAVAAQIAFAAYTFARNLRPHWQNFLACGLGLFVVIIGFHPVFAVLAGALVGYFLMHERMTRHQWTEEAELALAGLIEGITAKELLHGPFEEELKDVIGERNKVTKNRFDSLLDECPVLDFADSLSTVDFFDRAAQEMAKVMHLDSTELATALLMREREASTALDENLAVPHTVIDGDGKFGILMARVRKGIAFSDETPHVEAVFVLVGSLDQRSFYLCALATIAQMAGQEEFQNRWLQAKDVRELRSVAISARRQLIH